MADLPKPAHYWRDDVPGRAGPLLSPLFTADQLQAYATLKVADVYKRGYQAGKRRARIEVLCIAAWLYFVAALIRHFAG